MTMRKPICELAMMVKSLKRPSSAFRTHSGGFSSHSPQLVSGSVAASLLEVIPGFHVKLSRAWAVLHPPFYAYPAPDWRLHIPEHLADLAHKCPVLRIRRCRPGDLLREADWGK